MKRTVYRPGVRNYAAERLAAKRGGRAKVMAQCIVEDADDSDNWWLYCDVPRFLAWLEQREQELRSRV